MKKRRTIVRVLSAVLTAGVLLAGGGREDTAGAFEAAVETERAPILSFAWGDQLPAYWYAGDYGKKPVVRSQGKYGTCWAMSAVSAMEAALLPQEHIVFSADHMALNNAFTIGLEEGGDYQMIMAYLSGWQGPVTEEEDPYGDEFSPKGLDPAVHVQEIQLLQDADTEELKRAVYEYGAVHTSLYMSRATTDASEAYYNEAACAYYYPETEVKNHDILILGWDDSYSRFHFAQTPAADGAFICQNTWGSDFGNDGIFYVSYEDANIGCTAAVYSRIEGTDNYDRIYQTDDCGWQARQGYDDETCWFANVYTAGADEELAAVGFYATAPDALYEIWMVSDFENAESFGERKYLQSGTLEYAGYYTIDLNWRQTLRAGERFAVVIKLTTPGELSPAAVEYRAGQYVKQVVTEGKEGYLSQSGKYWENTEERFGTNVCLKAYTVS